MTTALMAMRVASSASRTRLARRANVALRRFWSAYWDLQVRRAGVAMQISTMARSPLSASTAARSTR